MRRGLCLVGFDGLTECDSFTPWTTMSRARHVESSGRMTLTPPEYPSNGNVALGPSVAAQVKVSVDNYEVED